MACCFERNKVTIEGNEYMVGDKFYFNECMNIVKALENTLRKRLELEECDNEGADSGIEACEEVNDDENDKNDLNNKSDMSIAMAIFVEATGRGYDRIVNTLKRFYNSFNIPSNYKIM